LNCNSASRINGTRAAWSIVLFAYLFDCPDLDIEEDGQSKGDDEEGKETNGRLVKCHLFKLRVGEEEVNKFIFDLDRYISLVYRFSVCAEHCIHCYLNIIKMRSVISYAVIKSI